MNNAQNMPIVKLMITIVDRGKGDKIVKICQNVKQHFNFIILGRGTANSEIMDLLGLGTIKKDIVVTMAPCYQIPTLIQDISKKMHLEKPGRGIIFSLPLSAIGKIACKIINKEGEIKMENDLKQCDYQDKFSLILAVVNQGFTDQLMTAARSAGATGGTVIHGRNAGMDEAENFLGIRLKEEREIISIIAPKKKRHDIMSAINEAVGMKTKARGIVFSMPVENLTGLS